MRSHKFIASVNFVVACYLRFSFASWQFAQEQLILPFTESFLIVWRREDNIQMNLKELGYTDVDWMEAFGSVGGLWTMSIGFLIIVSVSR
jgi:hypothetical protein